MKIVQHDIFGNVIDIKRTNKTRDEVIIDYEGFVNKFKNKVTTDDCYTPPKVYDAIKEWVNNNIINLEDKKILRPFKPGGDYIHEEYPDGCIVLDNPPFSILSQIRRFYHKIGVKYFLFAPAIPLANSAKELDCTYIISNCGIIYENGAIVPTSFITNLDCKGIGIWVAGDLSKKVDSVQTKQTKTNPRYCYPMNVCSPALLGKIADRGLTFKIHKESISRISQLDSQITSKKGIYGGGWLLSERAAAERAAAERAAAREIIEWPLSEREKEIIKKLK